MWANQWEFQSTPRMAGEVLLRRLPKGPVLISIHSPAGEATFSVILGARSQLFTIYFPLGGRRPPTIAIRIASVSIHAPQEGRRDVGR